MKKTLHILLALTLVFCSVFCFPVGATEVTEKTEVTVEMLENGDCIKTYITYYEDNARVATKSGSKTREYLNSANEVMWSVTVYGSFTYNGTTSTCTSVAHSTSSPGNLWSIKTSSSTKSGYSAIANATATYNNTYDYSMSVTLYCSAYGILS